MGLFDTIRCLYPLPGLEDASSLEFQTKDLGSMMNEYTITADGRLIEHYKEYEVTPEEERAPDNTPEWSPRFGFLRVIAGSKKDVDTEHHGWIRFYDGRDSGDWFEYRAKFTDGRLVQVNRLEPTHIDQRNVVLAEDEGEETA